MIKYYPKNKEINAFKGALLNKAIMYHVVRKGIFFYQLFCQGYILDQITMTEHHIIKLHDCERWNFMVALSNDRVTQCCSTEMDKEEDDD